MLEILYIIVMMFFLFGITIFVHEWGHFIIARKCGLVVETFSIGMGPAIWKKEVNGIVYKIGAFPIGGYVSLPQLDPEGMERVQGDNETDRKELPEVSPWKKIAVSVAGPLCNVILALVLAMLIFWIPANGIVDENGVFIAEVAADSDAYAAGLRGSDEIKAVNGKPVKSWYDTQVECLLGSGDNRQVTLTVFNLDDGEREVKLRVADPKQADTLIAGVTQAVPCEIQTVFFDTPAEAAGLLPKDIVYSIDGQMLVGTTDFKTIVTNHPNEEIVLALKRNGESLKLPITPAYTNGVTRIGVEFGGTLSLPWTMTGNPVEQVKTDGATIFRLLKALTTKGEAKQAAGGLGGPVAIFTMIWIALKLGLIYALGLTRFININLAVLNLLPIPVLDGGHICFALWEGITKRKVHPKVVVTLVNIFAVLLISAMIFLSWRDADRNWNVSRFFKKAPAEQVEQTPSETTQPAEAQPGK